MVILKSRVKWARRGELMLEMIVAMGILTSVLLPLGFSFARDQKLCRAYYHRATVVQVLDGELEILNAGEWKAFQPGRQSYEVPEGAKKHLPPGEFILTIDDRCLRLEWQKKGQATTVMREIILPAEDAPRSTQTD